MESLPPLYPPLPIAPFPSLPSLSLILQCQVTDSSAAQDAGGLAAEMITTVAIVTRLQPASPTIGMAQAAGFVLRHGKTTTNAQPTAAARPAQPANSKAVRRQRILTEAAACFPTAIQAPMSPSSTRPTPPGSAVDALLAHSLILQTSTAAKRTDHAAKGCTFLPRALPLETGPATRAPTGPTKTQKPIKTRRAPSNRNVVPVESMLTLAKRQQHSAQHALPARTKPWTTTETLALRMTNATWLLANTLRWSPPRLQTGFAALMQIAQNISTRQNLPRQRLGGNAARLRCARWASTSLLIRRRHQTEPATTATAKSSFPAR